MRVAAIQQKKRATVKKAAAPKVELDAKTKKSRAYHKIPGYFFQRIHEDRVAKHLKRKEEHQWTGYISPSANIALNMCMYEYFEQIHKFNEADDAGLEFMAEGNIQHEGTARETKKIEGLNYPRDLIRIPDHVKGWAEYIYPELPISCEVTGFRGKGDGILDIDSTPAPFDLKNVNQTLDVKKWLEWVETNIPSIKYFTQVGVYSNRMQAAGYFPVDIKYFGLAYKNPCMKPGSKHREQEVWWHFDEELNWYFQNFVYTCAKYRLRKLEGKPTARCQYEFCATHGNDKEIWMLLRDKRVELV